MEITLEPKLLDVMDKALAVETDQSKGVHKEPICMTRSDTMSIGSVGSTCSSSASIGGAPEGMDTEDSERDIGGSSGRGSFSSVDGQQKQLNLDNEIKGYVPAGDLTSPVIENKLSDDLDGYFVMRTRLMSQSAVILENGAAFGNDRSPGFCDNENTNMEAKLQSPRKCEDSGDDSEAETENREVFGNVTRRENVSTTQNNSLYKGWNSQKVTRSSDSNFDNEGHRNEDSQMVTKSTGSKDDNAELMNSDDPLRRRGENIGAVIKNERLSDEELMNEDDLFRRRKDNVSALIKNEPMSDDDDCQGLLTSMPDGGGDSSASESIAEVEKIGLNAKLARVSKRRIYSRARELSKASDSSSESDSDSETEEEDEEEDEKYEILDDIHEAKVLVNEAQPDSEKLIKREALKMAVPDDLLSDYASSQDSSAESSTDSSSGESSDSDDSSDLELSSAEESEEEDRKPTNRRNNQDVAKDGLSQGLPKVEYLQIDLPDEVQLKKLGSVSSILGSLVIIQAEEKTPALNAETVLFKPDRTVLGQVFEVFGPVVSPFYSVRFNAPGDIKDHDIELKTEAWFAPQEANVTQYVFTEQLKKLRGSDASWKNDEEVPEDCADFSDDETESSIRNRTNAGTNNKTKNRRRKVPQRRRDSGQDNWFQKQGQGQYQGNNQRQNTPRSHPPLQRQQQHPFRPPHHHHPGNQPWQQQQHPPPPGPPAFGGPGGRMRQSQSQPDFGSFQRSPRPRSFQSPQGMSSRQFPPPPMMSPQGMSSRHFSPTMQQRMSSTSGPPRPPSTPPMFQNPQAMGMPPPPFTPPQTPPPGAPPMQQPSPDAYQVGFSARKTENFGSWQRKTPEGNRGTFSARKSGVPPPWQQMMSPWQQQTPPPTPPPNSKRQPPPPGTLPTPPPSSSSSNHTNNQTTGPTTPPSSSSSQPSGPFNVALFSLPPPPPPKPPSHLPLFHTNAPATPNTPIASLPNNAPLAFNQEQVNHMFSAMQQGSASPSVTMTTPSPLSLMQNPWQASTSSPSPSTSTTSSPQPHNVQNLWQGSPAFSPSSPGFNQMSPSFAPPPVPPPSFHPRMMHSFRDTEKGKGKKNSARSTIH